MRPLRARNAPTPMPNGQTLACGRYCTASSCESPAPRRRVPGALLAPQVGGAEERQAARQREHHGAGVVVAGEPVDDRRAPRTKTPMPANVRHCTVEVARRPRVVALVLRHGALGGMVEVPHGTVRSDRRQGTVEVLGRRRRRCGPLEGLARLPRVSSRPLAAAQRPPHVPEERQRRRAEQERADRRDPVERREVVARQVARNPAGHAFEPEHELHEEREVEAHEREQQVHLPEPLVEEASGELREPVVDRRRRARTPIRRTARSACGRRRSTCPAPGSRSARRRA